MQFLLVRRCTLHLGPKGKESPSLCGNRPGPFRCTDNDPPETPQVRDTRNHTGREERREQRPRLASRTFPCSPVSWGTISCRTVHAYIIKTSVKFSKKSSISEQPGITDLFSLSFGFLICQRKVVRPRHLPQGLLGKFSGGKKKQPMQRHDFPYLYMSTSECVL